MHSNAIVCVAKVNRDKIVTRSNEIHNIRYAIHPKMQFTDKLVKIREIKNNPILARGLFRYGKNVRDELVRTGSSNPIYFTR